MTQLVLRLKSGTMQIVLTIPIYILLLPASKRRATFVSSQNNENVRWVNSLSSPVLPGNNHFTGTLLQHGQSKREVGKFRHQIIENWEFEEHEAPGTPQLPMVLIQSPWQTPSEDPSNMLPCSALQTER